MSEPGRELVPAAAVVEGEVVEVHAVPDGWPYLGSTVMTNFDHRIDAVAAGRLAIPGVGGAVWAQHVAVNFHGRVWHRDGRWFEQVWVHHRAVASYSAGTLEELMVMVNDKHGWE
jgi:hypothetical protein